MATVQDLKRRIRSIRNTRKITKAMELVASARLRRAQARIEAMRPYADRMMELMVGTARASTSLQGLTLLQRREVKTAAIVPLTGDRGLAGAFNAQVLRHAFALERELRGEGVDVRWLVAGKKGRSTLTFRRYELDAAWIGFSDRPAYSDAQTIAHAAAELYESGEVDRVVLVYNEFVSALVQRVVERDVLPIPEELLERKDEEAEERALLGDFIYEPEPEEILQRL
ncbi:MAG TPA: ATP synthase F1 subunit gamma, partial [Gaiellaceae bacterium]